MDAVAELGRNPVSKHQIQPEYMEMSRLTRDGTAETVSRDHIPFSGTNPDREILIFPVQLTTSRIVNLTLLIHTLAIYNMCHLHDCLSYVSCCGGESFSCPKRIMYYLSFVCFFCSFAFLLVVFLFLVHFLFIFSSRLYPFLATMSFAGYFCPFRSVCFPCFFLRSCSRFDLIWFRL